MKPMLNYTLTYGSPLSELITAKLTCFYNKVILKHATRLSILMPEGNELSRAELHKQMFDEISVTKFDPTNNQYWITKNLHRLLHFTHSTLNTEYANIFIDQGKIFKELEIPDAADIVACRARDSDDLINYVNKQLATYSDLPSLDAEQLVSYDFSAYFISDNLRGPMQTLLQQVVTTYPEYIDHDCLYAILSCLVAQLKLQQEFQMISLEQNPIDINTCGLVEDFYTLI